MEAVNLINNLEHPTSTDEALSIMFMRAINYDESIISYDITDWPINDIIDKIVAKSEGKFSETNNSVSFGDIPKLINVLAEITFGHEEYNIFQSCVDFTRSKCPIFTKEEYPDYTSWLVAELKEGHIHCVDKWITSEGFFVNYSLCCEAAAAGQLEVLKFLVKRNVGWNEWTSTNAAGNGHLDCLKYVIDHNCPYNKETVDNAIGNGHFDCFQYLIEIGYVLKPYKFLPKTFGKVNNQGFIQCLNYLIDQNMLNIDLIYRIAQLRSRDAYEIIKDIIPLDENSYIFKCFFTILDMIINNNSDFDLVMKTLNFVDLLLSKHVPIEQLQHKEKIYIAAELDYVNYQSGLTINDVDTGYYAYKRLLPYIDKLIVAGCKEINYNKPALRYVFINHCDYEINISDPITYIIAMKHFHKYPGLGNEYWASWILS